MDHKTAVTSAEDLADRVLPRRRDKMTNEPDFHQKR
jgi:hypothetical protein